MGDWDREKMVAEAAAYEYPASFVYLCTVNAFRALLEEVGLSRCLEAIRHYNEAAAGPYKDMLEERLGPLEHDLESLALIAYFTHSCTSVGHITPLNIHEGGATYELYSCPNPHMQAPPEFCIAMSHLMTESTCKAVNPEYEGIYTHHLANGDDCCRLVIKKKGSQYSLNNLGRLVKAVPPPSLSEEEMLFFTTREIVFNYLFVFTSILVDLVGSKRAMELIAPLARETGLMLGAQLKGNSADKSDLSTVKETIEALSPMLMTQGSEVKVTDEGLEREVTGCPCKGAPPEVCLHIEGVLDGVCKAFDPEYEFVHDRMITKGDPTCHWTIRRKGEPVEKEPKEVITSDDPVKHLANKLIDGEITEEEFERKMALLKKHGVGP